MGFLPRLVAAMALVHQGRGRIEQVFGELCRTWSVRFTIATFLCYMPRAYVAHIEFSRREGHVPPRAPGAPLGLLGLLGLFRRRGISATT